MRYREQDSTDVPSLPDPTIDDLLEYLKECGDDYAGNSTQCTACPVTRMMTLLGHQVTTSSIQILVRALTPANNTHWYSIEIDKQLGRFVSSLDGKYPTLQAVTGQQCLNVLYDLYPEKRS
jgi:hypothetical protein